MKVIRLCLAAMALAAAIRPGSAADMPVETLYQPRPAIVVFRWTGVHFGVHVGGAFGSKNENSGTVRLVALGGAEPVSRCHPALCRLRRDRAVSGEPQ